MRGADVFPSKYLKAADLRGRQVQVVMDKVRMEKLGDDDKPVLYFQGKEKGLVLNVTNWNNIALVYGDESNDWFGRKIVLFPSTTDYQGRTVDCIRVKPPSGGVQPAPAQSRAADDPPPAEPNMAEELDDEIPF